MSQTWKRSSLSRENWSTREAKERGGKKSASRTLQHLFLPSVFSLSRRGIDDANRLKGRLSISGHAPNTDPEHASGPFWKVERRCTRLSPECRRSRDSKLKGKAAGKPLCSLNRGRLRGWKYIMGNITDECWPVRETATSGDNLVTWTTSVRPRVFPLMIFC